MSNSIISSFDVMDEMKKVASNYFDVTEAQLRVGLFGHIVESMGKITEHSVLYAMLNSREKFISTARKYETLLIEAAQYGINSVNARPSQMDVYVALPIEDMLAVATVSGMTFNLRIDRDTVITLAGYKFMLEFPINIIGTRENSTSKIVWKAVLDMDDRFDIAVTKNPYIISSTRYIDGLEYLLMKVTCRQVEKLYVEHNVIENDDVSLLGMEFEYEGQLAMYNIYYRESTNIPFRKIRAINYLSSEKYTEEHMMVNATEPGIIAMYANSAYFKPAFNSSLLLEIYTTRGSESSFTTVDAYATIELKSFEDSISYTGIRPSVFPLTDALYGADMTLLEDLRQYVIYHKSTLDVLLVANDLQEYFKRLNKIDTMHFVEKRSDILERRFTGFMIPRETNNAIIPALTTNIAIKETDFDYIDEQTQIGTILPKRKFSRFNSLYTAMYDVSVLEYIEGFNWDNYLYPRPKAEVLTDADMLLLSDDPETLLISSPYLIRVGFSPKYVGFFNNSISMKNIPVSPVFATTKTTEHMLITHMNIERFSTKGDQDYKVTFRVISTYDLPSNIFDGDGNLTDTSYITCKLVAYNETGNIAGHVNCTLDRYDPNSQVFFFKVSMSTEDKITDSGKLLITNMTLASSSAVDIQIPPTPVLTTGLKLGLAVFVKSNIPDSDNILTIAMGNNPGNILTNIYSNVDDPVDLFVDMSNVVKSTLAYDETMKTYIIRETPVFSTTAMLTKTDHIYNSIQRAISILNIIKVKVVNNFALDFKFYKTYGPSKYFKINDDLSLEKLKLSMMFKIHLRPMIREDLSVLTQIKEYVKSYIETINFESDTSTLFTSNLITSIETKFKDQLFSIDLVNMNNIMDPDVPSKNLRVSSLTYNPPDFATLTHTQVRDHVPEYLNIELDDIEFDIILY